MQFSGAVFALFTIYVLILHNYLGFLCNLLIKGDFYKLIYEIQGLPFGFFTEYVRSLLIILMQFDVSSASFLLDEEEQGLSAKIIHHKTWNSVCNEYVRLTVSRPIFFGRKGEGVEQMASAAQFARIAAIFTPGSIHEIGAELEGDNEEQMVLNAAHSANLKSRQTLMILPAAVCLGKPGMLLDATPTTTASLALHQFRVEAGEITTAVLADDSGEHACLNWRVAEAIAALHQGININYSPRP